MSEFWKSNPKKYCEYCKVWLQDNKASISIHESGKNHKDKVKEKLNEIKKKAEQRKHEDKLLSKTMAAIEKSAMDAMVNDISSNPSLRKQYGSTLNIQSETQPGTSSETKKEKPKKILKQDTKKTESSTNKRKSIIEPEAKIGKWQTVEAKKPCLVETKPVFVDLQLPTKSSIFKKLDIDTEDLQNETSTSEEKNLPEEPKSKWIPFGGFEPVVEPEQNQEIKQEKEEPTTIEVKKEEEKIVVKTEPEEKNQQEKIPTLKLNSKKEKPIMFKKRNKEVSLRERTDD